MKAKQLLFVLCTATATLCVAENGMQSRTAEKELKSKLSNAHVEIEGLAEKLTGITEQILEAEKQKKQLRHYADPETKQLNDEEQAQYDTLQANLKELSSQSHKISKLLSEASKKADMLVQRLIKGTTQRRMAH